MNPLRAYFRQHPHKPIGRVADLAQIPRSCLWRAVNGETSGLSPKNCALLAEVVPIPLSELNAMRAPSRRYP
jgi:hypothetical protein